MERNKATKFGSLLLGVALIGVLLQGVGWLKGNPFVFPGVGEIMRAFLRLLGEGSTWLQIWTTLKHLLAVLAVSTVLGTLLGLAEGMSDFVYGLFRPMMIFLRAIPMIVLVVVIMVLTAYARVPLIASSLVLIPMISEATCEGCRRIDRELIDIYRMNSAFNFTILRRVYLPLTAGYMKQAYMNAVGMGVKMVVTTEYLVQTRDSLGKAVYTSAYFNEYADIYAYALIMILLVLLLSELPQGLLKLRLSK